MSEKSILEQALLQVQTLEEAVKANAKGILASTMKQELNELLKESEEEEEEEVTEEETDSPEESTTEQEEETTEEEEEDTTSEQEEDTDSEEEEEEDLPDEDEMSSDDDEMDTDMDSDMDSDTDSDEMDTDTDDTLDMTGSSDEEVLKVFKSMKPEDGIVVKKDGDNIELNIDDEDYIIQLDEEEESDMEEQIDVGGVSIPAEEGMDEGSWNEEEEEETNEETIYEIELDEEDEEEKEEEMKEAARTKSNPHGNKGGMNRSGLPSKKRFKAGSGVFGINEEFEKLKKQNSEYKKALVLFKEKLNEVAVFNANLAYATRLFTEHSTTKQEKLNILKRFDSISTMNESKSLFNVIKTELETKKPVTESVVDKITSAPSTSSTEVLSESKAYENPQFKRMKDLMSKIK